MIKETVCYFKNNFPSLKNMGLLAAEGIYKTKLYDYYVNSKNISIIIPKKSEQYKINSSFKK